MIADGLYKDLTYKIIGALYEVHKELGSVHKETIYHKAAAIEFTSRNILFIEEKSVDHHGGF
jgi:GxxExxY protein